MHTVSFITIVPLSTLHDIILLIIQVGIKLPLIPGKVKINKVVTI